MAYVFAYVSGGASYVFAYVFLYAQHLPAVCCCCFVRCMATGSYRFSIRFSDMLVAAAGSSWLLKPFSAYVRLTFCLRFSYVKNGPYETLRKPLFGQWQRETHKEAQSSSTPSLLPVCTWPYKPYQKHIKTLWGHTKTVQKTYLSNVCYSWLTFLLTFLAGRLTFFLTFSYKVRTLFGCYILILS